MLLPYFVQQSKCFFFAQKLKKIFLKFILFQYIESFANNLKKRQKRPKTVNTDICILKFYIFLVKMNINNYRIIYFKKLDFLVPILNLNKLNSFLYFRNIMQQKILAIESQLF